MIDRPKVIHWRKSFRWLQDCALASVIFAWLLIGATVACAQSPTTKTIVDFSSDALIKKISVGTGVSISRLSDDALEVRVAPFSQSKNQWPLIAFGPDYFPKPINLAPYSRLETVLHHETDGISNIDFKIATAPDGSRNVDEKLLMIPGHAARTLRMNLKTLLNNDPSRIALIEIVFSPRATETVYRLEPIRAVYDPADGSPADQVSNKAAEVQNAYDKLNRSLVPQLPADQQSSARRRLAEVGKRVAGFSHDVESARSDQFYDSYRTLCRRGDDLLSDLGKLRLLDAGPIPAWMPDRYLNFNRQAGPGAQDELLKHIDLHMAGNQLSDFVFMVCPRDQDLSLGVELKGAGDHPLPASAMEVRHVDYIRNFKKEDMGDALLPRDGPVEIPAGQSRQFWLRFNTRTVQLSPGRYTFNLILSDEKRHVQSTIPGTLEVWNFSLPGNDVLPDNSYVEFNDSDFPSGEGFAHAIADMKLNGLNQVFINNELPCPLGLNDQWQITGYDDKAFNDRVRGALKAWNQAPGDGTLHFIISLSGLENLGLKRSGYAFPNEHWKTVFVQWLDHLKSLLAEAGLTNDRWMLVLGDEADEPALMNIEIPWAQAIKRMDPSIRITCNSSTVLSDPQWTARYFKTFDMFQPVRSKPQVVKWLHQSGKPIWLYECDTELLVSSRDLYSYYRLYSWDMLREGVVGTGVWTYCSHPPPSYGEPAQGCILIYNHPKYGLVHSRRYEMFRQSMDDYRYVAALRSAAAPHGEQAVQDAQQLIQNAITDVLAHPHDHRRCGLWRSRLAERIIALQP